MADISSDALQKALDVIGAAAPAHETPDGGKAIIYPATYRVHQVGPLEPPLTRIRQAVRVYDSESFCAYVNKFKLPQTQMFAVPGFIKTKQGDASGATVTAIIDYHEGGPVTPQAPAYCAHTVRYLPRYSEQWERWTTICERPMKQAEFAEFIEEMRGDIVEPSAASLFDIVRAFKAAKKVEYDSVVYQSDGTFKLSYDEKTEQRGSSGALPEKITIGIPVYFRGSRYKIDVFVRFRIVQGGVVFQLKIDQPDVVENQAFDELTSAIAADTGITPYLGVA